MIYHDDELLFVAKVKEYLKQAENQKKVLLTKFLTLREQAIIEDIFKYSYVDIHFYGGFENAERKRCLIIDPSIPYHESFFEIVCYRIEYNKRYLELRHQNVLGTLMSLKLDRSLFGDILIDEDVAYFFTTKEAAPIVESEFVAINRVPISVTVMEDPIAFELEREEFTVTVPSMRIDTLISHVFRLSRSQSVQYIEANYVYRNFQIVTEKAASCLPGDVISVRRHGRFTVGDVVRQTKKNKIVLSITKP